MDNIPLGKWSGSDATNALRKVVEETARETGRQNRTLLWMTGAILVLTFVITGLTLWLVLHP